MSMSMSFYFLLGEDLPYKQIENGLKYLSSSNKGEIRRKKELFHAMHTADIKNEFNDWWQKLRSTKFAGIPSDFLLDNSNPQKTKKLPKSFEALIFGDENDAFVAKSVDSKWLSFFDEGLCDGFIATGSDAQRLSEAFHTPVVAFTVLLSDLLTVYFCNAQKDVLIKSERPKDSLYRNQENCETVITETTFPSALLLDLTAQEYQEIQDIWNSEDYVCAEEKIVHICKMLHMGMIFSTDKLPNGFKKVTKL